MPSIERWTGWSILELFKRAIAHLFLVSSRYEPSFGLALDNPQLSLLQ
ncbi:hypothetical protein [Altericista sp. CCNU0014]